MSADDRIRFHCPHCSRAILAAGKHAGKEAKCPGCGEAMTIPRAATGPAAPAPGRGPTALLHCFLCGEQGAAPSGIPPGQRGTACPACGGVLTYLIPAREAVTYRESERLRKRGQELYRADELEASIAEFRKALALTPRHPVLLVDLGDAVSDLGWRAQDARILQESLVHLSHALQLYPDYGRAAEEFDMATERHGVLAAPRRRKARGEGSSAPRPARTDQSLGDWVADELEADAAAWRKREAERLAAKGKRYWNLCVCEGCGIRYVLGVNSVVTTGDGVVILFQTDTHVLLGVISSTTPDRIALKAGHPSWPEWAAPPEPDGETPALVGLAQSRQRIRRWTCEKCGATHDYPWS